MTLDLVIVLVYALGLVLIGWYSLRRARSREDYLVAGRRLGPVMYAATLSTVVLGGASTVGTVRLGYVYGLSGLWFCTLLGLGILVISLFLSRRLVRLNLVTVIELLQRRYNPTARLSGAVIMIAYALMVAVASIVACGTILHGLFGLPFWGGVLLGGGIVVLYSVIGGMWSITLTDILQFFIMTVGMMFLLAPMSIQHAGGWDAMRHLLPASHFSLTALGLPMMLGFTLNYFLGILIGQDIWQRVFTARSVNVARFAGTAAAIYCVLYGVCGALIGMAAKVLLPPLADPNTAFASVVQATLPNGIRGLVVAAALAAMMSTASATLMAAATTFAEDVLPRMGGRPTLRTDRLSTLAMGVLALGCSLALNDVFRPLTIAYDLLVGSLLVPIVGAIYWQRGTTTAAITSMVVSAGVTIFFLIKDGLDANSPIFFGLGSSLLVFCSVSMLGGRHASSRC
jgi:SSS family solute:Na+ symporter